ncbi:hypothetical protein DVA86_28030 [Streptomyces armeniacus]|uniref:PucR C-terminal helix-turn-helix domain-containing protein n=1 Tax=Streptomyces armeniacus TaxID=83291 RepID=A0A345XW80_9ACTN|nr:SAM-dependent methyltransferase [Streptomyces armeniacus]AXK35896.1 hypothetical protein DVA86_28030 [Streptomyces armeniacus]
MLTLGELTAGTQPEYQTAASHAAYVTDAAIEEVVLCDGQWEPAQHGQLRYAILVCQGPAVVKDGEVWTRWAGKLAQRGVVAIVVAGLARGEFPAELVTAASRHRLPLLVPTEYGSAVEVRARLLERQVKALASGAGQSYALLHEFGRLHRQGEGPLPLLRNLGKQVGGRVRLLSGGGDWGDLAQHTAVLDDIAAGQKHSAKVLDANPPLLLHPVGSAPPYEVLAAERPGGWPAHLATLIRESVGLVHPLRQPLALRAREKRLEHSEAMIRVSVLQDLMAGKVTQAARAAAPLLPGFLADEESIADGGVELGVLQVAPGEERIAVAAEVEMALGWTALVVLCPAEYAHVIILLPSAVGTATRLAEFLRPLVERVRGRALGVGQPVAWGSTSRGYTCAIHALAQATAPGGDNVAVHDGSAASLARELPDDAWYWAAALLDRSELNALSDAERRRLYDLTQLALTFGPTQASRLLGSEIDPEAAAEVERATAMPALEEHWSTALTRLLESDVEPTHRNTVSRYRDMLMDLVGLDPERLGDRAVMSLALQRSCLPKPDLEPLATPTLAALFATPEVTEWADHLLVHLTDEQQELLTTWLDCEADTTMTALELGLHRNTVRERLRRCGGAISRPLVPCPDAAKNGRERQDSGSALDDLYFALAISDSRPGRLAPDPVASRITLEQDCPDPEAPLPPGSRVAGVYDASMSTGGKDAHSSDRQLMERIRRIYPTATAAADENRGFVRRSTRWLAQERGIRQFLDIGCGLYCAPNVHEIAEEIHPDARTVYVDNEPEVRNHMQVFAQSPPQGRVVVLDGDLREPNEIRTQLTDTLDLDQPVAVLLNAVLHFVEDRAPLHLVRSLLSGMPTGSALTVTYATTAFDADTPPRVAALYREAGHQCSTVTREEFLELFDDLELVDPGAVAVHRWRPDNSTSTGLDDNQVNIVCGVGLVR